MDNPIPVCVCGGCRYYSTKDQFMRDITLMFDNCKKYNSKTSEYFAAAEDLHAWCRSLFSRMQ